MEHTRLMLSAQQHADGVGTGAKVLLMVTGKRNAGGYREQEGWWLRRRGKLVVTGIRKGTKKYLARGTF